MTTYWFFSFIIPILLGMLFIPYWNSGFLMGASQNKPSALLDGLWKEKEERERVSKFLASVPPDWNVAKDPSVPTHLRRNFTIEQILSKEPNIEQKPSKTLENGQQIKVMQYNILAEIYGSADRFYYLPKWALEWNYRKENIIKEIQAYNPDILCMQEVDHFDWMSSQLKSLGYYGEYSERTSHADGTCIFFKENKFQLLSSKKIDFNQLKLQQFRDPMDQHRYHKNNVGLIFLLERIQTEESNPSAQDSSSKQKHPNEQICVASAHLYWDPKLPDLKVKQSHILLNEVEQFLNNTAKEGLETPIIISGDFNAMPNSGVYELYSTGKVPKTHSDFVNYPPDQDFTHPFQLKSAYSYLKEPVSNITPWFKGTIDYIWFSNISMDVHSILLPLTNEEMGGVIGLPSSSWSSDHVSLICDLYLKNNQTPNKD